MIIIINKKEIKIFTLSLYMLYFNVVFSYDINIIYKEIAIYIELKHFRLY